MGRVEPGTPILLPFQYYMLPPSPISLGLHPGRLLLEGFPGLLWNRHESFAEGWSKMFQGILCGLVGGASVARLLGSDPSSASSYLHEPCLRLLILK